MIITLYTIPFSKVFFFFFFFFFRFTLNDFFRQLSKGEKKHDILFKIKLLYRTLLDKFLYERQICLTGLVGILSERDFVGTKVLAHG